MRTTFDFKTILLFTYLLSLTTQIVLGQNKQDDWMTYSIPNVVSFKVPPTMEVRSGDSFQAQFVKAFHQSSFFELLCDECDLFYDEAKLVLQPLGLNSSPDSEDFRFANNTYGRIIFNFSYEDLLSQEDIKELTPSDLTILDTLWRNEVRNVLNCVEDNSFSSLLGVKGGSFKWYPLKKKQIGGLWALVTEYDRPGMGVETHVQEYKFFYEGKFLLVTMSYNKKHEAKYKDDFKTFIQYLNIETTNTIQKQTSKGLFSSKEYHVRFSYDSNNFAEAKKVNKNSHCFCKLESANGAQILLSAWDCEYSTDDISIHDREIIEEMKQNDMELNEYYDKMIASCNKVNIGNVEALMSVMSSIVPGINTEYIITKYRAFYKDRFYTFDFYIPVKEYNKNKNIVNELIKGLQFN